MQNYFRSVLCVFLILIVHETNAQTGKFFSTDDELSNSLVNKVYQDRKGFIWIATEDGLNKFDGTRFFIYMHNKEDPASLKNNYVRTLYEDSFGRFWIGCLNGLQLYDRSTDKFREVNIYRNNSRVHSHITGIIERDNGEIWMTSSGQGVISVRPGEEEFVIRIENELTERINSKYFNAIFEDSFGYLWIASEDKGLFRFSPEKGELISYKAPQDLPGDDVSSICEDKNGNIFIGTLTNGVFILSRNEDGFADKFTRIPYRDNLNLNVKTLVLGKQGNVFVGTDGDGLKVYNPAEKKIEDYEVNTAPFDYSKSKVHSILEDRDNNLWLGIFQKGLILIPGMPNNFQYYGYRSLQKNTIGSGCVMSVWSDRQGITWIGTDNDGLYAVNDEGEQVRHYRNDPLNSSSVPGTVMAVYEDSNSSLWLGSYFNGIARMDKHTGRCKYLNTSYGDHKPGSEKISCMLEDDAGNLWVGTFGAGIQLINLATEEMSYYESTRDENQDWKIDRLPNDWITSIIRGNDKLMWIGTYNGLACYHTEKQTFLNFFGRNNLLPGYLVYSLLEASDGNLWIGTTQGLVCFRKETEEFKYYTITDGLPSDVICGMIEDEEGNIWISTHKGVSKLIVGESKFINYYAADGLQGNEFSRGAVFKDNRGKAYFGGTNGITTFWPREIKEIKKDLHVSVTGFYLANQSIKKGDKSDDIIITTTSVMDANELTLAHNDHTFSLEFSAFEFSNPGRIIYQYRIDEPGSEWISTHPGVNRITYTNLSPGKYNFQVRATDHNNVSAVKSIIIHIMPPWYQTTAANVVWVLLTCFLLYVIILIIISWLRRRQEMIKKEHREQLNEAKLQFFMNISHEIRTPMTLIISPLEKLLAENSSANHHIYMRIYRNAQRILRLINQLMDIRKLDKGQMHMKFRETDMIGFIEDLMQTFEYQAEKKKIKFVFNHTDEHLYTWVDLNNFDKILMNVLSNAFKYTPEGGEIEITVCTGSNENTRGALRRYFEIRVSDTGIGIDQNKIEQIFERFYQVSNDVTNSYSGTGIGLHLARSLVTLHHGIIKAENREEGGACFIIRIPLGSDHLRTDELENPEQSATRTVRLKNESPILPVVENEPETIYTEKKKSRVRSKVMVVEDDDEIRQYISEELGDSFRIYECINGKEALERIMKEKPDLIISDVMMPEMDGISLSRKIKQNVNVNHIPIILLTARSKTEDRIEGLESGADAYLVKPFNADVLRTTVNNLIRNRERLKSKFTSEKQIDDNLVKIEKKSADDILMEKVLKTINNHLSDSSLNVELLAANVGMSRVHMHRKLKELTGQSARDYIKNIRLKQASILLKENKLTVSEIAYAIGFTNISHFSNSFREYSGMSPSEYREVGSEN